MFPYFILLKRNFPPREGTKIFTPCPQKIGFGAQKRPNLAQNWHFGPNIGIFGPFDLMPDQKTMQTSCLGGFSIMWVPKLLLTPIKLGFFCPNTVKFCPNWHFWPNIGIFGPFDLKIDQKTMQTSCLGGFLLCWYQNFYLLQ